MAKRGIGTLRRFVENLRTLAYECAEGTAPKLIAGHFELDGEHCALGLALARSHNSGDPWTAQRLIADLTDPLYANETWTPSIASLLISSNNNARDEDRHAAVVFPLLAMADRAEEALQRIEARR